MSDSVWPHRWQPTRLCCPWDSPGKNTGVGCHFLFQCRKVRSESEVALPCPTQRPHGLQPTRLLRPWDFPGTRTGVGCYCPPIELIGVLSRRILCSPDTSPLVYTCLVYLVLSLPWPGMSPSVEKVVRSQDFSSISTHCFQFFHINKTVQLKGSIPESSIFLLDYKTQHVNSVIVTISGII